MKLKLRQRIAYKHAKNAVILAFVLGVVLSGIQIVSDYQSQTQKMLSTLIALKESSTTPATEAVWNLDEGLAQSVVEGLFTNEGVLHASIEVENGVVLAEKSRELTEQPLRFLTSLFFGDRNEESVSLNSVENGLTRVFGHLHITYDPHEESIQFFKRACLILVSGVIKNLLLAVLLFALFYRGLTQPLEHFAQSLESIKPGEGGNQIVPFDKGYDGEFLLMFNRLNYLIDELNNSVEARERIQSNLNGVNVSLEKKVRERTEEIRKQKNKADRANLAKNQFLATMSHEIRTPLNSIIGLSSIQGRGKDDETLTNYLTIINSSAKELLGLLNEISDITQLESKRMTLSFVAFSVNAMLRNLTQAYQSKFEEKGIQFNVSVDQLLPATIIGDEMRLSQVMSNLLSNAHKFTNDGSVNLRCELLQENELEKSATILFSVKDTGVGINPNLFKTLFEPFSQVDMSNTREHFGSGLGLAVSSQIITLMGSTINVESVPGEGTEFSFQAKFDIETEEADMANSGAYFKVFRDHLKDKRLLLVEDIEVNRFIVEEMLSGAGLQVTTAINGKEALNRCQEADYDVVLMDVQMPVMDGCEATYMIRNQLGNKKLPIIALTANALQQDKDRCIQSGMNDFLTKPVQVDELLEKIMDWV